MTKTIGFKYQSILALLLFISFSGLALQKSSYSISFKNNNKNTVVTDIPSKAFVEETIFRGNITYAYEWNETAKNPDSGYVEASVDVAVDSLDNVYILGAQDYRGYNHRNYFEKYNSAGDLLWNKSWIGPENSECYSLCVNKYGEIFMTGSYYVQVTPDWFVDLIFLVKFDTNGNYQWNKTWGLEVLDKDAEAYDVCTDSAGDVYVVGTSSTYTPTRDILLLKYTSSGTFQWYKLWGGDYGQCGIAVTVDSSDNICIAGRSYKSGFQEEICVLKYNTAGTLLWAKTWGTECSDYPTGVVCGSNNEIFVIGYTYNYSNSKNTARLIKYNSNGDEQWNITSQYPTSSTKYYDIVINSNNNLMILSSGNFVGTSYSFVLLKYNTSGTLLEYGGLEQWPDGSSTYPSLAIDNENNIYTEGWFGFSDFDGFKKYTLVKFGIDSDRDHISDNLEICQYFTNPYDPDTDGDGFTDYQEISGELLYYVNYHKPTNATDPDTDHDGLSDWEELSGSYCYYWPYWTDPNDDDSDNDLLTDYEEILGIHNSLFGYIPTNPNEIDTDGDLLSDFQEVFGLNNSLYNYEPTNPNEKDSDDDKLWDNIEINNHFTNPNDNDTDDDLLSDYEEISGQCNTDPLKSDTDGDGWSDYEECIIYNTDPNDPYSYPPDEQNYNRENTPNYISGFEKFFFICSVFFPIVFLILIKRNKMKSL